MWLLCSQCRQLAASSSGCCLPATEHEKVVSCDTYRLRAVPRTPRPQSLYSHSHNEPLFSLIRSGQDSRPSGLFFFRCDTCDTFSSIGSFIVTQSIAHSNTTQRANGTMADLCFALISLDNHHADARKTRTSIIEHCLISM